ncbi:hypothetical protein SAMD00023353_0800850 [Rosellinia necatrix]|uniref:Uncharacterized protein n=1 Tax=Rosellinia necatrix TaxID=77044 RepID=A0A1S8A668_ROSNE|nr:hypothetical protein SAMD00023353_0800850 [Rosellinia necatrix]
MPLALPRRHGDAVSIFEFETQANDGATDTSIVNNGLGTNNEDFLLVADS